MPLQFTNFAASYLFSLIGILILYYFLQGKRKKVIISSVMLWENVKKQEQASKPRWIFKPDLLFLLQLLILILLIIAIMKPQLLVNSDKHLVIVIDRSASMQATDVNPDRFTETITKAITRIRQQEEAAKIALISAVEPEVLLDFTLDKDRVIDNLDKLEVTDMTMNIAEALKLARAKLGSAPGKILFYTDNMVSIQEETENRLQLITTGGQADNIGITHLDVRRASGATDEYEIMVGISNFSAQERRAPIIIGNQEEDIIHREVSVAPGNTDRTIFNLTAIQRKPLTFKLDIDDNLQVDNVAYTVIGTGEKLRILKIGPENHFMNSALKSHSEIELVTRDQVYGAEYRVFDLVIYDRITPPAEINGKAVFIKTVPDFLENRYQETVNGFFEVSDREQTHQLLDFVNLNQLRVKDIQIIKPPANSVSVATSTSGSLLIAGEKADLKWLYFAFALQDSTFPLQVGFPVFLDNMIKWFFPQVFVPNYSWIKSGEEFTYMPRGNKELNHVIYQGQEIAFTEGINQYLIRDTMQTGFYQLQMNDSSQDYLAVNLLSAVESDLRSERELVFTDSFINEKQNLWQQLWPYFVLLVILLVIIEWYYYHQPEWSDYNAGNFY